MNMSAIYAMNMLFALYVILWYEHDVCLVGLIHVSCEDVVGIWWYEHEVFMWYEHKDIWRYEHVVVLCDMNML